MAQQEGGGEGDSVCQAGGMDPGRQPRGDADLLGLVASSVQSGGLTEIILSSTGSQVAGEENIPLGTTNQAFLSLL